MSGRYIIPILALALPCLFLASCKEASPNELPRGLSLQAWPTRLAVGGSARVSAFLRDPSPSLPEISWTTDHGSILKGAVANEIVFRAPHEPRSCTLTAELSIEGTVFKDSVFITASLPVDLPGGLLAGIPGHGRLAAAASDSTSLFSDRSPLYSMPLWPGPRDALNVKLRVRADIEGQAWIHLASEGREDRRRPMAPLGANGDFRYYGAQIQGSDAPVEYWFELSDGAESIYCSVRGAEPLPPPRMRRFRLLPPYSSAEILPATAGANMAQAIAAFLDAEGNPLLYGDGSVLASSLVAAAAALPQNRFLEPLEGLSSEALSASFPASASDPSLQRLSLVLALSAVLPGGMREAPPEGGNVELDELVDRLLALRGALSSLRSGSWICMPPPQKGVFAMARWDSDSRVLALCRAAPGEEPVRLPLQPLGLGEGQRLKAVLGLGSGAQELEGHQFQVRGGGISVGMDGPSLLVLTAQGMEEPSPAPPLRPRLTSILPADGARQIPGESRIIMQFTETMDQAGIERAFSISPPVRGTFFWNDRTCTFVPLRLLDASTRYVVTIDGTWGSRLGGYRLAQSVSFRFTTR